MTATVFIYILAIAVGFSTLGLVVYLSVLAALHSHHRWVEQRMAKQAQGWQR